jgi:hypothetical protein
MTMIITTIIRAIAAPILAVLLCSITEEMIYRLPNRHNSDSISQRQKTVHGPQHRCIYAAVLSAWGE